MKRGQVRIIGGQWRGRRCQVPKVADLRPTPDRVRETLFNWLGPHLAGARCLDAFAGSGSLGFEVFSRGAQEVVLVENSALAFTNLKNACSFRISNFEFWAFNLITPLITFGGGVKQPGGTSNKYSTE